MAESWSQEELFRHIAGMNAELAALRDELRAARDESDFLGRSLKARTRLLNERVKELACVREAARLLRDDALSVDQRVARIVDCVPKALQFPDRAAARAAIDGREFLSPGFLPSAWTLIEPVLVRGRAAGILEAAYLRPAPAADEGPFLKEERALLRAVADCLGLAWERR